jgi:hypothetical protein
MPSTKAPLGGDLGGGPLVAAALVVPAVGLVRAA